MEDFIFMLYLRVVFFKFDVYVWRLAGDTLNITCNFLYCNYQAQTGRLVSRLQSHHTVCT
jgi:hypothetical protein